MTLKFFPHSAQVNSTRERLPAFLTLYASFIAGPVLALGRKLARGTPARDAEAADSTTSVIAEGDATKERASRRGRRPEAPNGVPVGRCRSRRLEWVKP